MRNENRVREDFWEKKKKKDNKNTFGYNESGRFQDLPKNKWKLFIDSMLAVLKFNKQKIMFG